jgi:hypothetical protein
LQLTCLSARPVLSSYRDENFKRAGKQLRAAVSVGGIDISADGISLNHLQVMDKFAAQAQTAHTAFLAAETEMEEAPDEFLCPVSCDLMLDPVRLPTSGQTMERASLERHLLSDPCDPFNRKHLTIDMCEPDEEMKAKIAAWRADPKAYAVKQEAEEAKQREAKNARLERQQSEDDAKKAAEVAEQQQLLNQVEQRQQRQEQQQQHQQAAAPPAPAAPAFAAPAPAAPAPAANTDEPMVDDDEDAMLQAALAMSLQQSQPDNGGQ